MKKSPNTGSSFPSMGGERGGSIIKLIQQGEHQQQDFKFCVNDSRKIARSLVAFANTDGGRLLIGVKDNGSIAGVRSDEEYYMVEAAAKIYSKPEIPFSVKQHLVEGKTVLEVKIEPSAERPHFACDENGKWRAYYRKADENLLATKVMIEVWKRQKSPKGILINYSDDEKFLLDYLTQNLLITVSKYARAAHISFYRAENIIINFLALNILKMNMEDDKASYCLNEDFDRHEWDAGALSGKR
jgi:hypothetical protein